MWGKEDFFLLVDRRINGQARYLKAKGARNTIRHSGPIPSHTPKGFSSQHTTETLAHIFIAALFKIAKK